MVFCTKCGAENPDDAKFCHRCGQTVFQSSAPPRKLPKLLVAINVLLLAVIQVALIFVVPVFNAMFADFGSKLPALTAVLISVSAFWQNWWWGINSTVGFGVVFVVLRTAEKSDLRWPLILSAIVLGLVLMTMFVAAALPIIQLGEVAGGVS